MKLCWEEDRDPAAPESMSLDVNREQEMCVTMQSWSRCSPALYKPSYMVSWPGLQLSEL